MHELSARIIYAADKIRIREQKVVYSKTVFSITFLLQLVFIEPIFKVETVCVEPVVVLPDTFPGLLEDSSFLLIHRRVGG